MGTPHINAKEGAFAKIVLMPGDPMRAKWIAETFLHDVEEVTTVRGMLGYTGYTKNGKRISVMGSGMGMPSIGIYSYELFTVYGVESIIRVGTAGTYQPYINVSDIIIATTSSSESGWSNQFGLNNGTYSAGCDFDLAMAAVQIAKEKNIQYHTGNILSADAFYNSDQDVWKKWARLNVLGVEMESYALYCNAARLRKKALCILTVSDSFLNPEMLTVEQRATGLKRMIELAVYTAEKFA